MVRTRGQIVVSLFVVASVASCVHPETTFNSRVNFANAVAIDRLLVVTDMENAGFSDDAYRGFQLGMTRRLETCGVQSFVLHDFPEVQPDLSSFDVRALKPVAMMTVQAVSPPVITHPGGTARWFTNNTQNSVVFALEIVDLASNQKTWVARSRFDYFARHNAKDAKSGVQLATDVVSRLRDDRVLLHCPAPGVGWPDIDASATAEPAATSAPHDPGTGLGEHEVKAIGWIDWIRRRATAAISGGDRARTGGGAGWSRAHWRRRRSGRGARSSSRRNGYAGSRWCTRSPGAPSPRAYRAPARAGCRSR
jgi:hypothetical protein